MELQIANGGSIALNDDVFAREFNEGLVHQAVVAYMAAGRAGTDFADRRHKAGHQVRQAHPEVI